MELPTYFKDFLAKIRPQSEHISDYIKGHKTLRDRLNSFDFGADIIVVTFLQGSYRRATAIRPHNGKRADIDVIVVTRLSEDDYTPQEGLDVFLPFLDKFYAGKYKQQGRSFGIELSYVDLDLVITSAPSEAEIGILQAESVRSDSTPETEGAEDWRFNQFWLPLEKQLSLSFNERQDRIDAASQAPEWKLNPLRIPDCDTEEWQDTHPLEQIRWTWEKNRNCNSHYVNVVKAIKWWRREKHQTPKYPKGYPVEHLIGECCPDGITSVAEGVTRTLHNIAIDYQCYVDQNQTPELMDRGVPSHNVFKRVTPEDFTEFHSQVCEAANIARQALDEQDLKISVERWQQLFGKEYFPDPPQNSGGYTPRRDVTRVEGGRFA
ncbi:SMODS domain-containing nucleotidyltransferase [Alkalinema pantanalense CENA528]|uniref:SMODS domain-containing nucleotidyltransferase n=1 Tax=Alkalinema pantanalense TaxID=1620705 RepID=UPI003D6ED112